MQNEYYMERALALAERARGRTSPNPPVGAVVVRDGVVVGEGWTQPPGEPHAEVMALRAAGAAAHGADLYATLEPCTFWGRTPPCTDAIRGQVFGACSSPPTIPIRASAMAQPQRSTKAISTFISLPATPLPWTSRWLRFAVGQRTTARW